MKSTKRSFKPVLFVTLGLGVVIPSLWLAVVRMEGAPPVLELNLASETVGTTGKVSISVKDEDSGVRKIWMSLLAHGREVDILQRSFPSAGFFSGGKEKFVEVNATVSPQAMNLEDGKGVLRVAAWDYSLRKWGKGNRVYLEKEIRIDTQPPTITLISRAHNIAQGGAGLAVYRLSEECPSSGVVVDDRLYPGTGGYFSDSSMYMAFFALDYRKGKATQVAVEATDAAGNKATVVPFYHINTRSFRKDAINLSDRFLQMKLPEFERFFPDSAGEEPMDLFLKVNRDLRLQDTEAIYAVTQRSAPEIYWEGAFLRLPRSANRARFADHRTYFYNGKVIDRQVHMGIDLASTAQSEIPAANHGKVVFVGDQGIYGNTVIIDHGFGLFTLYGHLSHMEVTKGTVVQKGQVIGRTGMTGMAGGDHLHYSMLVHQTYVNPLEWWDAAWIKNNVTAKIESAGIRKE